MSDESSEARPTRGVPGLILGGLAAGAILGTPVVAVAAPVVTEAVAAVASSDQSPVDSAAPVASNGLSIREQFRISFTPGAVSDRTVETVPIIIRAD
jgi:hypothetical protein